MKKYICLTTIPARFDTLTKLLESFIKNWGNYIDGIRIYIPYKYIRFPEEFELPELKLFKESEKSEESKLQELIDKKVKIVRTLKDYGPLTKTIGPLIDNEIKEEDIIYITDDDIIKSINWFFLLSYYIENKNTVCQISNNMINKQIHGSNGFAFKKGIINKEKFKQFINKIPLNFYFIDDDLLTIYLNIVKTKIYMVNEIINKKYITHKKALVHNSDRDNLRKQLNAYINNKFKIRYNYKRFI